jgi:hypothetical protein
MVYCFCFEGPFRGPSFFTMTKNNLVLNALQA